MTKKEFQEELERCTSLLLNMGRTLSWNKISNNCRFVVSAISIEDSATPRIALIQAAKPEAPVSLAVAADSLYAIYNDLYDINLYIYKASGKETLIDIKYLLRSAINMDCLSSATNEQPMFGCKVILPPWYKEGRKFNINWIHNRRFIKWKSSLLGRVVSGR